MRGECVEQAHHAFDHLDRSFGIRVRIAHGRNRLTRQTAEIDCIPYCEKKESGWNANSNLSGFRPMPSGRWYCAANSG
jgi:hypothetical protein